MTNADVSNISLAELTKKILDVLMILDPLSPTKIKKLCEDTFEGFESKAEKPSHKLLLNNYFEKTLGFKCGIEKVAEQDGKKKIPVGSDYDLIFHITVNTNAIQTITLRLLAPLSVRNFLNFQTATIRPKPNVSNAEIQAFQAAAYLNGQQDMSVYRKRLVINALVANIDPQDLQSRSEELHKLGIYVDEVEEFLLL